MKKLLFAFLITLSSTAFSQQVLKSDLTIYKDSRGANKQFNDPIKFTFKDPRPQTSANASFDNAPTGYVLVDGRSFSGSYRIKYLKTTRDNEGVSYWYVIVDNNETYDVFETRVNRKTGKYVICFAKYGENLSPSRTLLSHCN